MSYGGTRIPPHNRKGACRKLSTYGCARRISTRRKDLYFTNPRGLWTVPTSGGEPELVSASAGGIVRWSTDGKRLFFRGRGDKSSDFWSLDLDDLTERRLTALEGRRGRLSGIPLASDGEHLYFSWGEDFGDIW